jgi:hypothetical protein
MQQEEKQQQQLPGGATSGAVEKVGQSVLTQRWEMCASWCGKVACTDRRLAAPLSPAALIETSGGPGCMHDDGYPTKALCHLESLSCVIMKCTCLTFGLTVVHQLIMLACMLNCLHRAGGGGECSGLLGARC